MRALDLGFRENPEVVSTRRLEILMTKNLLDVADRTPLLEEQGRGGVTKGVRSDTLFKSQPRAVSPEQRLYGVNRQARLLCGGE